MSYALSFSRDKFALWEPAVREKLALSGFDGAVIDWVLSGHGRALEHQSSTAFDQPPRRRHHAGARGGPFSWLSMRSRVRMIRSCSGSLA